MFVTYNKPRKKKATELCEIDESIPFNKDTRTDGKHIITLEGIAIL